MNFEDFPIIPASKKSMAFRKLVCGCGVNDASYITNVIINGNKVMCPAYKAWKGMITRCYSKKLHSEFPTYTECHVDEEWLLFSNFREWFVSSFVDGYELDKDLKIKGNKLYSKDRCLFLPGHLNSLILDGSSTRGEWPKGVYYHKAKGRYISRLRVDGRQRHIGVYDSPELASTAYARERNKYIDQKKVDHPEFAKYLDQHKEGSHAKD